MLFYVEIFFEMENVFHENDFAKRSLRYLIRIIYICLDLISQFEKVADTFQKVLSDDKANYDVSVNLIFNN